MEKKLKTTIYYSRFRVGGLGSGGLSKYANNGNYSGSIWLVEVMNLDTKSL